MGILRFINQQAFLVQFVIFFSIILSVYILVYMQLAPSMISRFDIDERRQTSRTSPQRSARNKTVTTDMNSILSTATPTTERQTTVKSTVVVPTPAPPRDSFLVSKRGRYHRDDRVDSTDSSRGSSQSLPHIPRRIHQTYKTENIVSIYKEYILTWLRHHPSWEYWFWSDADIRALVRDRYFEYLPLFDSYKFNLQRADVGRYFILHHYGGVYVDMDFVSRHPLDDYIRQHSCILTPEPFEQSILLYSQHQVVTNAIMAVVPGHEFFETVIRGLQEAKDNAMRVFGPKRMEHESTIIYTTGPNMLQRSLQFYAMRNATCHGYPMCSVTIAPSAYLVPNTDAMQAKSFMAYCKRVEAKSSPTPMEIVKRQACATLREHNFVLGVRQESYAEHKWLHFGYEHNIVKANGASTENITMIFADLTRIVTRYRTARDLL